MSGYSHANKSLTVAGEVEWFGTGSRVIHCQLNGQIAMEVVRHSWADQYAWVVLIFVTRMH